jgi:enamine deaminase RidA (YjgF/YER057c/UK114 family)
MAIRKEVKGLGMPWEDQYGYAQAVKVDDTIYVSGQLSHDDEGNIVAGASPDGTGTIRDHSNLEAQMRQTYKNAKKILGAFGAPRWMTSWRKSSTSPIWTRRSPLPDRFARKRMDQRGPRWRARFL